MRPFHEGLTIASERLHMVSYCAIQVSGLLIKVDLRFAGFLNQLYASATGRLCKL